MNRPVAEEEPVPENDSWTVTEMTNEINARYAAEPWTPVSRQSVQRLCRTGRVECWRDSFDYYHIPKSNLQAAAEALKVNRGIDTNAQA